MDIKTDVWGWTTLQGVVQDIRHASRALRNDRLFTAVAILVLGFGIGGNTAVFSVVNALLLNPFPYPDADRLIEIKSRAAGGTPVSTVPLPDFLLLADGQHRVRIHSNVRLMIHGRADLPPPPSRQVRAGAAVFPRGETERSASRGGAAVSRAAGRG